MGIVNTRSQIVWRRYTSREDPWDSGFFARALDVALRNREEESFRRLVWSEADDMPGLVVDQFGDYLVVQALTLGVELVLPDILDLLQDLLSPRDMVIRNDAPSRKLEGLTLQQYSRSGKTVEPFWAKIYEIEYLLDLHSGQKTGFYLDQRQEHFKVATFAPDWRVLDAFCNQGAFALQCAAAGAREVLGLDSSEEAITAGRANARKNELQVRFERANVFDFFSEREKEDRFDLIILDPPSFAPNRKAVPAACRGYKELQLRALQALSPGGILATYCCSHHVGRDRFLELIEGAAVDSRRPVQLLYHTGQPLDHPVRLGFPESFYLKGCLLRVND
jgi:23S rRNA (cytosine1962-C5)-methyltransferase